MNETQIAQMLAGMNAPAVTKKNDNYTSYQVHSPSGTFLGYMNLLNSAIDAGVVDSINSLGLTLSLKSDANTEYKW